MALAPSWTSISQIRQSNAEVENHFSTTKKELTKGDRLPVTKYILEREVIKKENGTLSK